MRKRVGGGGKGKATNVGSGGREYEKVGGCTPPPFQPQCMDLDLATDVHFVFAVVVL